MKPVLIILAGPKGAGKSTFFETFLEDKGLTFVNADVLAHELDIDARDAADTAQRMRKNLVQQRESFVTETVFWDPVGEKLSFFEHAEKSGYAVTLIYIGISSVRLSRRRVEIRSQAGGHDVPQEKLAGRYERSLRNLEKAIQRLSQVIVFDNSSFDYPFKLVAKFQKGKWINKTKGKGPAWAQSIFKD